MSETAPKISRLQRFEQIHDWALHAAFRQNSKLSEHVRKFLLRAMKPGSFEHHVYRSKPQKFVLEEALLNSIDVFDSVSDPVRVYHLKQLRRFLLSRFAFSGALLVNSRLRKRQVDGGERESWLWLYKDTLLPRMGLSIALGFALLFGASALTYLAPLAHNHPTKTLCGTSLLLLLDWFLISLNVRDYSGRVRARWRRSIGVWMGCLGWLAFYVCLGRYYHHLLAWTHEFFWSTAGLMSSLALLFAILGQFLFGKSGSIAEPL